MSAIGAELYAPGWRGEQLEAEVRRREEEGRKRRGGYEGEGGGVDSKPATIVTRSRATIREERKADNDSSQGWEVKPKPPPKRVRKRTRKSSSEAAARDAPQHYASTSTSPFTNPTSFPQPHPSTAPSTKTTTARSNPRSTTTSSKTCPSIYSLRLPACYPNLIVLNWLPRCTRTLEKGVGSGGLLVHRCVDWDWS